MDMTMIGADHIPEGLCTDGRQQLPTCPVRIGGLLGTHSFPDLPASHADLAADSVHACAAIASHSASAAC